MRSASVKDVAARAGVSLGTVSNVLNRPDRVSSSTRERVEAAMGELGFVRNESARQLRTGTSQTLAYVVLDASNPFFTDVARGMEGAAEAHGLSLVLCNSGQRPDREAAHLALFAQQRVQGILVTPVDPTSPLLDRTRTLGTPVVIVDRTRHDASFCSVSVDDELGGRLAVEHLVDRGHRRIAFIGGPMEIGQITDRLRGARAAWADAGRPAEDLVVLVTDWLDVAGGREAGARLAGMSSAKRPTAAFCANDLIALGLLQHAISSGTSVPEQLAIVGYDDIEFAAAAAVPLSSVRQPRHELGRAAADLLLDEAGNPDHEHRQVQFTPELVARRSTG
ncbi:LacI family DNA-binding transcriptional regulator [Nocardioides flavescens]|uniref:Substrate-binding domain-containing protein n=1 Tax=Nocardioides flavescens TaxID=2691959 RepID=A0A6L7EVW8_9ACTN|nr:LacI family DNA-binding transcriptional regulator [Nocardioides flavescens]MXG88345.1 substrate-binding domain-containing protein [Nocardioides flavescens]